MAKVPWTLARSTRLSRPIGSGARPGTSHVIGNPTVSPIIIEHFKLTGCPFPIFSYFLSLFLFSPIFKLKPPIFPIFLVGEGKICNKIENGIKVVCVFGRNLS